jgi:hypothetical protein
MRARWFRDPDGTRQGLRKRVPETDRRSGFGTKEAQPMVPLLLWILGVPGLIIILLLLLGILHL